MIVVTGVNGFVGKHLVRELNARNCRVIGLGNTEPEADIEIRELLENYVQCDITNQIEISKIDLSNVSAVINLAGLANVGASFDDPDLYMKINVEVVSIFGKELFKQSPKARMIAVSSGAVYYPNQPMPINEKSRLAKNGSPYVLSKLAMEDACEELRNKGFDCIVVRPFNHIGPGQGQGFLIPDMVNRLKNIELNNTLTVGNIKTSRDYTDVRDIVKAYTNLALADSLQNDLYNVCSGRDRTGEEIIKAICRELSVNFNDLRMEINQDLIRASDPEKIVGDCSRIQKEIGWQPKINLNKTISDIVKSAS